MIVPPLVHLPVFITMTLILRDACTRSLQVLSSPPSAALDAIQDPTVRIALENLVWCPSLADVDPYTILPLAVSLSALTNVEIQAALRGRITNVQNPVQAEETDGVLPIKHNTALRASARPARVAHPALGQRRMITMTLPSAGSAHKNTDSLNAPSNVSVRSRAITNVLRFGSILFLPVAAYAPVVRKFIKTEVCRKTDVLDFVQAVNLYWLTSNVFSVVQNLALAYIDRKDRLKRGGV